MLTKNVNGKEVVLSPEEEAEIRAEWARNEAEQESVALIEAEKKEMPSEKEMLEAIWKKVVEGDSVDADALQAERLRVKEKYKKK